MTSKSKPSPFRTTLRRLKPEKHLAQLKPRPHARLQFVHTATTEHSKLLYDTTVYVDVLQGRFPPNAELFLRAAEAWHSTVTGAELATLCGLLDPRRLESRAVVEQVSAVIDRRPGHRTLAPDREIWDAAGVLAGILARLQQYSRADRRRALNDALVFSTARKYGLTVLTRNVTDFDFLQQLDPAGKVLFYLV